MGHQDEQRSKSKTPMTEEQKRTPGAWPGNPEGQPANSDEPPTRGQQFPGQETERPDESGNEVPLKHR